MVAELAVWGVYGKAIAPPTAPATIAWLVLPPTPTPDTDAPRSGTFAALRAPPKVMLKTFGFCSTTAKPPSVVLSTSACVTAKVNEAAVGLPVTCQLPLR